MNKEKRATNNNSLSASNEPPLINRSGTYVVEATTSPRDNSYQLPRIDNANSRTVTSNRSLNLSILKQTKRAELLKQQSNNTGSNGDDILVFAPTSHNRPTFQNDFKHLIRNARRSGQLNLSGHDIVEVPMSVWRIDVDRDQDDEKDSKAKSVSFDKSDQDESKWWTYVELTKLILASNKIRVIPREVNMLSSLTVLDVSSNLFLLVKCYSLISILILINVLFQ